MGSYDPKLILYHHTTQLILYHHTTHPVSSSKDHSPQLQILLPLVGPRYNPFNLTHTISLFKIQTVPISFWAPVLASPDKAPTPKAGKTVPVRNGINPANTGKILLLFSCCGLIAFLTFLLSWLSFLHMPALVCQLVNWLRQKRLHRADLKTWI